MAQGERLKKKALSRDGALAHADVGAGEISPFREAIAFHRQKIDIPTKAWTDIMHEAHDRAFVVAGAMKEALLEDIHQAMIEGLRGELPFDAWLERFDEIVARHGWSYRGGRTWRARVIFETNLRTARAAGRFKQMRHPDTLAAFPYWRYVHAFTRVPNEPREEHESWDGLILPATDPWWETYYPPNGWRCSCGVEVVTEAEMRREKGKPDIAPEIRHRKVKDPLTGEMVDYPDGVDFGWAYAPGHTWAEGISPRLRTWNVTNFAGLLRSPADPPPLAVLAKPFETGKLPEGLPEEEYVRRFLTEFGADIGQPVRFTDAAGHGVLISEELFRDAAGRWKVGKRGRAPLVPLLAETVRDPDEIWLSAVEKPGKGVALDRRYLRFDPDSGLLVIFEWNWRTWSWEGVTAYPPKRGAKGKTDTSQMEKRRQGVLLYRREQK